MITLKQFISERYISPGINPNHEQYREKYRDQFHNLIRNAYSKVDGGYGGLGVGSDEESNAIHQDISDNHIKAIVRNGRVTAVNLYKDKFGRKIVATGHDGSDEGKKDWKMMSSEDATEPKRNVWGEVSGAAEKVLKRFGHEEIPVDRMGKLTGKEIEPTSGNRYKRNIGGSPHEKVGIGNPKKE